MNNADHPLVVGYWVFSAPQKELSSHIS